MPEITQDTLGRVTVERHSVRLPMSDCDVDPDKNSDEQIFADTWASVEENR